MEPVWGVTVKQMLTEPLGEITAWPAIGLGSLSPLGEILDGCRLVRPLLFHFFSSRPRSCTSRSLALEECFDSPASLLSPPPKPSLKDVLTCPSPRKILGEGSRVCAAPPAPPGFPAFPLPGTPGCCPAAARNHFRKGH